jgi:PKD repeat protein
MKIFLKRIFFLLAIVLGATQIIVAQGEANIWYFGFNAGLDFNTSPPTPLTNGQLATWEGCASIADKNGALVFYTDGTTVWDKTHTPMPNGNGLFGNSSSTQSAIIVPYPGTYNYTNRHFDKYFIVTVDHQAGSHGVNYSEVDMTLNNGLGDVTATKNVHLYDASVTSEKICVAPHSNNCDFWVIGKPYANVDYYAYPITSSGFNTTPVISSVGPAMDNLFGSLKTSPDSKLVVATHSGSPNGIYVYDFNNTTGVLTSKFSDVSPGGYSYSQEFSPDNKILYWTLLNNPNVYQFDLTVANNPAFLASRQIIGTTANGNGFRMCALQIAPDGKIYAALQQQTSVSVINNPNVLGVGCGYVDMQQSLAGKVCGLGLPALVTSLIRPVNKIIISDSCVKQTVQFNLLDTNKITGYNWSYAKLSTPNNVIGTSAIYNPTMQFDTAGDYLITAVNHYACFLDTIIDTISILPLPIISLTAKNVTCFGLNNGSIVATSSGTVAPYTYTWSNSATTDTIKHLAPAAYSVSVTDAKGCISHDSAVITSPVALQVDTIIVTDVKCFGDSTGDAIISVSGGTAPYSYSWNTTPTQTTQHALALPAGTYTCTVTDSNSCVANRSAIIIEPPLLTVNITNHLSVCRGSSGNLNAIGGGGFGTLTYSWIPGNITTPVIDVGPDSTTKYILTGTDSNNCIAKDSSLVIINPNPVVSFGATLVCVGDSSVFTDSTTITSGSIATYNWTFGLGSAGSTLQNPTYSYINCNTYTIGLTAISDSGCTYLTTHLVVP